MKKSKKFLIIAIILIIIGLAMIGLGIAWPFIMDSILINKAKNLGTLKEDNYDYWKSIPGVNNITINNYEHLYECINYEDVC